MNSVPMDVECIESETEMGEKQQLARSNGMHVNNNITLKLVLQEP